MGATSGNETGTETETETETGAETETETETGTRTETETGTGNKTGTTTEGPTPSPTRADVREALDSVYDPELDRSLAELRYIGRVEIDGDGASVTVDLRLPTGLCSPAFAWMMASDARAAIEELADVESATVRLVDHVDDEAITEGVNAGASFAEVFEGSEGDVDELRGTLDHKARMGRQHEAVTTLREAGVDPSVIVALTHGDLRFDGEDAELAVGDREVAVDAEPFYAFVEKVEAMGLNTEPDAPLFLTPGEEAIPPEEFESVRQLTRLASVNMGGQAHHCSVLLEQRYGLDVEG